ncbi:RHS repeat-associated core domain-containing protein [Lysobacter fragariae]
MEVLKRAGLASLTAVLCFFAGLATPYSTVHAQSAPQAQTASPSAPDAAQSPQSMASMRLEAASRHMDRITRELRGRAGAPADNALETARRLQPHLAGLRSLDLVLNHTAVEDRIDMDRVRMPSAMRNRFESDEAAIRKGAAEFRPLAERIERAIAANSEGEADAALDALAAQLAQTDVTRRPAFNPESVRAQNVRRETRKPAATKEELQAFLAKGAGIQSVADPLLAANVAATAVPELAESEETRITPRIQAQADALGHNPVRIYNWVHSNIDFIPGQGAIQGADLTLRSRQGNATDINSLLVSLLRASGIPARFVYGTVDVPLARAVNWLRARDTADALNLVQMAGIPSTLMLMNGQPQALRLQHLWVEAFIDFTPSRGAVNRQPDAWIPMDASFKQYTRIANPLDVLGIGQWNTQAAANALGQGAQFNPDGSFTGLNTTAYQAYRDSVANRIAQSTDLTGINDPERGLGLYAIVPSKLPVISGTLPFAVSTAQARYPALPASLKHYLEVALYASQRDIAYENPMLSLRVATVTLGGQSLYVEPKAATPEEELTLKSYADSNAASLPLGSFNVIPQVKLGGQVLAQAGAVRMGTPQFWTAGVVDLQGRISGVWEPYEFAAGSHIDITPDLGGMTPELADSFAQDLGEGDKQPVDKALHLAGVQYWLLNDMRASLFARGAGGHFLRAPSVGVFAAPLQVRYFFGIPRSGSFAGFATDIKADRVAVVHDNPDKYREIVQKIGANGSLAEGMTWDLLLSGHPGRSLSSSSILTWANRSKVPIHAITEDNIATILPKIQTTADVKSEIQNAVASGMYVIIPEKEFSQGRVQAAGYVIIDPETGAGVYRVDGGLNGAINWGCIAKAVILNVLCEKKFIALVMKRLAGLALAAAERAGLMAMLSVVCPAVGAVFAVVNAVLIAVTLIQAAYEVTTWVKQIMEGLINLTPEEMAELGIKAINDYACNYLPGCLSAIPGMQAANDWANSQFFGYGDAAPNGGSAGNPVTIGNGVKTQIEPDYEGSGPFPLSYTRVYLSYMPNGSPVGHKWSADYQQRLVFPDGTTAMVAPDAVMAQRPDGGWRQFNNRAGQYSANGDVAERIERITDGLARTTGWRFRSVDDTIETYDAEGRLQFIENRIGLRQTLAYDPGANATSSADDVLLSVTDAFGRSLRFEHDPVTRQVTAVIEPDDKRITYAYVDGALTTVTYPDNTSRRYHYEVPGWPTLLTGITDERGIRYASWKYDDESRVTESVHADGADRVTFAYGDLETRVTDARNTTRTYRFTRIFDTLRMTEVNEPCATCGAGSASKITYDGNGYPYQITDNNNVVSQVSVNGRGLPEQWTRGVGKPEAQTVSVSWHPTWHVPTVITETGATGTPKVTRLDYDSRGNLKQRTVTVDGKSRVWTYEVNAAGQVTLEDGPRTDVQDVTRYEYDSATGNRTLVRDANDLVTRYPLYDRHGRVSQMVDPNGLITDYRYDERGRLRESRLTSPSGEVDVTAFKYAAQGALERVTLPDNSWIEYSYDNAQRVTGLRDSKGSRIVYSLNAAGDREQEDTYDPSSTLAMTQHRVFNQLGRLAKAYGSNVDEATLYTYDDNGNERFAQATLHQNPTESRYDGLNRLMATVDPMQGSVEYRYDTQDNLRKVIDPRQLATSYDYNGFNELETLTSPDTGVTRFTYDAAGNIATRLDARNANAAYSYDAANRISSVVYPDETLGYSYDESIGGLGAKGRLTTLSDGSGRTRYIYDAQGRVQQKIQQLGDDANTAGRRTVAYTYAGGHFDETVLPSGARLKYRYGADGRVLEISVNGVAIVRDVEYFPFGEPRAWTTVVGRYERAFDTDGRVTAYTRGVNAAHLRYDTAGRVAELDENAPGRPSWQYGYDDLDRLKSATNASGSGPFAGVSLGWSFDVAGNRTREVRSAGAATTTDYAIDPASNRLAAINGAGRQYDNAGNTILANGQVLRYSSRGRLVDVRVGAVVQASYAYNGLGERVCVATGVGACPSVGVVGNAFTQFVYDEGGHLLGEYAASGALLAEHVWLGNTPVAVLKSPATSGQFGGISVGGAVAYLVQPDHLDTPRNIVNGAGQSVWRWDSGPYGDGPAEENASGLGEFSYRLRFPGQQYDAVTRTHYNYLRDYDPSLGRYVQSDPLGLDGDLATYNYVGSEPLWYIDPNGEKGLSLGPAARRIDGKNKPDCSPCSKDKRSHDYKGLKNVYQLQRQSDGMIFKIGIGSGESLSRCEGQRRLLERTTKQDYKCVPLKFICGTEAAEAFEYMRQVDLRMRGNSLPGNQSRPRPR